MLWARIVVGLTDYVYIHSSIEQFSKFVFLA